MKFFLSVIICSSIQNVCIQPHVFPTTYNSSYECLLDGYMKAYEKTIEIGKQEVNKHGIYIKFDCQQIVLPKPKPKGEPT